MISGPRAIARFAGRVQGVVVQMAMFTGRSPLASRSWTRVAAAGTETRGKRTKIEGLTWSAYSTSASASAVVSKEHQ
ncbi:hypothetical protein D3C86_1388970 [compost metagenome]